MKQKSQKRFKKPSEMTPEEVKIDILMNYVQRINAFGVEKPHDAFSIIAKKHSKENDIQFQSEILEILTQYGMICKLGDTDYYYSLTNLSISPMSMERLWNKLNEIEKTK